MNLKDELDRLARAHGPSELASAFSQLQGAVKRQRREDARKLGPLAQTLKAAMAIWDQQKTEGVPRVERVAGLEKTLRAAWPKSRERPWQYLCDNCNDLGLVMRECSGDAICGRQQEHYPHSYGKPCWCPKGSKFKIKPPSGDDFTSAGKGFSKAGR